MLLTHSKKWFADKRELQEELNDLLCEKETILSTAGVNLSRANDSRELTIRNHEDVQVELEKEVHFLSHEVQLK